MFVQDVQSPKGVKTVQVVTWGITQHTPLCYPSGVLEPTSSSTTTTTAGGGGGCTPRPRRARLSRPVSYWLPVDHVTARCFWRICKGLRERGGTILVACGPSSRGNLLGGRPEIRNRNDKPNRVSFRGGRLWASGSLWVVYTNVEKMYQNHQKVTKKWKRSFVLAKKSNT